MRVLKFGGTSVAAPRQLRAVAAIVADAAARERVVVVVSALGGVTDELVAAADAAIAGGATVAARRRLRERHLDCLAGIGWREDAARALTVRLAGLDRLLRRVPARAERRPAWRDAVLASGERCSVELAAAALGLAGLDATAVDAARLVVTDSRHGEAAVDQTATERRVRRWLSALPSGRVPVVTGYIGGDRRGRVTTLGRGGSDLSASVLGAAVRADLVEIWTDVDGVMTAPPRLLAHARTLPALSYEEAAELARLGAKVLHPETIAPLVAQGIPVVVRNTFAPGGAGTRITASCLQRVRAIAVQERARHEEGEAAIAEDEAMLSVVGRGALADPRVPAALASLERRGVPLLKLVRPPRRPSVGLVLARRHVPLAACLLHDALVPATSGRS